MNTLTRENEEKIMFTANSENFINIPGNPIAYWIGEALLKMFGEKIVSDYADTRSGMSTTDNERFLRFWQEVNYSKVGFDITSLENAKQSRKKWFPYNKGGEFRRWYGNNELLVNWYNDGEEVKYWVTHNPKDPKTTSWSRRIFATDCFFKKGITWTSITTGKFSCRAYDIGFIFDSGANGCFVFNSTQYYYLIGYMNSKIFNDVLKIINPTINNGPGTIGKIPMKYDENEADYVTQVTLENIDIAKKDWDDFETSWDFRKHPLV